MKEIAYGQNIRKAVKQANRRQRRNTPLPKIYQNSREDLKLFESEEDQIRAVMVDVEFKIVPY